MSVLVTIAESWTKRMVFTLSLNGVTEDLTNYTVSLVLRASALKGGTIIDTAGKTSKAASQSGAGKGKMYFDPGIDDLKNSYSPMTVHWVLVDSDGKRVTDPTGDPDTIVVARL